MVRQYQINLNRQEGFVQREERKRKIRERITLVISTLLVLAMAFMNYRTDQEMRGIIAAKQHQLNRIIAQIDSLQQVGRNVSKDDVLSLARLDHSRVFWTKKFHAMAEKLPDKMAITELKLDRNKFELGALCQINKGEIEFDKVALLIDRLRSTPVFMEDFRNIKFAESQRQERDGQELLEFAITCEVDRVKESSAAIRRARRQSAVGNLPKKGS